MITVVLEASTYAGSAAILNGDQLLGARSVAMRGREHELLMATVGELVSEYTIEPREIGRIACGAGPGSFTSLRIAASIAKGLAFATGAALLPVSSLRLMAASYRSRSEVTVLATLDAMRGQAYAQPFRLGFDGFPEPLESEAIVDQTHLSEVAERLGAVVIGPSASGIEHVIPDAASAVHLTKLLDETAPADLTGWQPTYGRLAEAQVKWEALHGRPLQA